MQIMFWFDPLTVGSDQGPSIAHIFHNSNFSTKLLFAVQGPLSIQIHLHWKKKNKKKKKQLPHGNISFVLMEGLLFKEMANCFLYEKVPF